MRFERDLSEWLRVLRALQVCRRAGGAAGHAELARLARVEPADLDAALDELRARGLVEAGALAPTQLGDGFVALWGRMEDALRDLGMDDAALLDPDATGR